MLLLLPLASAASYSISLHSVTLAPTQPDGTAWDGPDTTSAAMQGLLQNLLSPDMVAAAKQAMNQPDLKAMVLPDVAGVLTLGSVDYPTPLSIKLPEVGDSLTPSWCSPTCPTLTVGRLHRSLRLQLSLTDTDVMEDDPIGTIEIGIRDIKRARRAKEPLVVAIVAPTSTGSTQVVPLSILSVEIEVKRQ